MLAVLVVVLPLRLFGTPDNVFGLLESQSMERIAKTDELSITRRHSRRATQWYVSTGATC